MRFLSMGYLSNGGHERNKIWHKGSLKDEDDVQTSNTHIAQRKSAIPHSTVKNNHNIIVCVVITLTRGRHVPANKHALALWTSVTLVTLLVHRYIKLYITIELQTMGV